MSRLQTIYVIRQVSVKPTRTRNGLVGHLIQCLKTITGINFNSKLPETRK